MDAREVRFDDLLRCLKDARVADEEMHRRNSSLEERTLSHRALVELRAKIANLRIGTGFEPMETSGLHDSRTSRSIDIG